MICRRSVPENVEAEDTADDDDVDAEGVRDEGEEGGAGRANGAEESKKASRSTAFWITALQSASKSTTDPFGQLV